MKKIINEDKNEPVVEEEKKTRRKEGLEKRKQAKSSENKARWSGLILFVILLIIGFLLSVSGEVNNESFVEENEGRVMVR